MSPVLETVGYWGGPRDGVQEAVALAAPEGFRLHIPEAPEGVYILTAYAPNQGACIDDRNGCPVRSKRILLWQVKS